MGRWKTPVLTLYLTPTLIRYLLSLQALLRLRLVLRLVLLRLRLVLVCLVLLR